MNEKRIVFRGFDVTRPIIWAARKSTKLDKDKTYEMILREIEESDNKEGGVDDEHID
ncbi:MAG: hypothetical protein IJ555_00040 [Ruminococcus sp.]|nr:hypothetical protein [Ruminococcus sp.]